MSRSVKAKVDELLARGSYHLWESNINEICAAMEVQLYRAETDTLPKRRQFMVCINRARQAATIWSDGDRQQAIA
jgi:hypothetical protein